MEGGFFRQTYSSSEQVEPDGLPSRYRSSRPFSTCIYYMLTPRNHSALHRVSSDEIFHFYLGDPVEMLQLIPEGAARRLTIGIDIARGHSPQVVVPAGVWQGARLAEGGSVALLGATVAPGFDPADFEPGIADELAQAYPGEADLIRQLAKR